jgi:hypothetical protein
MKANTIAVTIKCTPEKAFQYISNIKNLLVWAPAFADSITNEGVRWIAKKGKNIFEARIVSDERYGIVDFQIIPAPGVLDVFPSRVVANGQIQSTSLLCFKPLEWMTRCTHRHSKRC